ncbi:MAG: 5'/3'-nucleotidase SurE [Dehalococcoidia bacterium]|nr:5'/3'-nucleotidase SurE [Dehalococcoidia bacterium]
MRILLTNDDGVHAPGIRAAAEALREIADVLVCAPDREQSGTGTSVSLQHPVRVSELAPIAPGVPTYTVEGTPCDAAIIALESLRPGQVDLVVSGINCGSNLGEDVLVSGTVGAALQGYFRGIPSIAISVASLTDVLYEPAGVLLKALVKELDVRGLSKVLPKSSDRPLLLNVNLPNLPREKLADVQITRLGRRAYADVVKEGHDGRRKWFWVTRDKPVWELVEGTDVWAVRNQHVSVTPLHTDLTHGTLPKVLAPLAGDLRAALKGASPNGRVLTSKRAPHPSAAPRAPRKAASR